MIESFDQMWGMLTSGAPPVKVLFDKIGPDGQRALEDQLRKSIEERFGSGPITTRNTATVGVGCSA